MNEESIVQLISQYQQEPDSEKRLAHFNAIHKAVTLPIYKFFMLKLRREDAEDLSQDTVIAIMDGLPKFRAKTDKQFYAWCYQIARNKRADHYRRQNRKRVEFVPLDAIQELLADPRLDPVSAQDKQDLDEAMKLLANSKPACRKLLWEHFINGLDITELAKTLGLKYDAVRMRIDRCLSAAGGLLD